MCTPENFPEYPKMFDEISKTITDHGAKMNLQIEENRTIPTDVTVKGVPTDINSTYCCHV